MSEALKPQAGDILWADRGLYFHCGIYSGGGRVIHFAPYEGMETSAENAVVHETTLEHFTNNSPVKIINCPAGFTGEETVRRARSRIGEKGYDLASNNCEHFAEWCKTGEHTSIQVNDVKNVIKIIGGETGELICGIHDVVEQYKAAKLPDTKPAEKIIEDADVHTEIDATMPVAEPLDNSGGGEETKNLPALVGLTPEDEQELGRDAVPYEEDDGEPADEGDTPPRKKAVIDKVAGGIKTVTFAVAGALEVVKHVLPGPLKLIPFQTIALKVASTIDKAVVHIKRFFGTFTAEEAHEELQNIDAAVLGETVAHKQTSPIREVVKNIFGKVGAGISRIAGKVVSTIAPAPVRNIIKRGAQKVAGFVSRGIRVVAKVGSAVVSGVKKVGQAIGGFFSKLFGG